MTRHIPKQYFFNGTKRFRQISLVLVVFVVAAIGTYLLTNSHAATPYASTNADKGTLDVNGTASVQTDSSAADGKYVRFGTVSSTGGGGNNMIVGLNYAGWGVAGAQDVHTILSNIRWDASSGDVISNAINNGLAVDVLIPFPLANGVYDKNGVSDINASTFTANTLSYYKTSCGSGATAITICPELEVLNEPGGNWFWGSNAQSQANATAYDTLLQSVYTAFHTQYGTNAPKILGSYDGGHDSDITWGQELYAGNPNVGNYVDGWTLHPYGSCDSTLNTGHQSLVTQAHANTGKPIYVTEVGWTTHAGLTCTDVSEQQQADNIYNFVKWARSTGYVNAIYFFGYRDYGTPTDDNWWGVERWQEQNGTTDGSQKPGWNSLKCAAENKAENCP